MAAQLLVMVVCEHISQPPPQEMQKKARREALMMGKNDKCDSHGGARSLGGGALGHPRIFINVDKPGAHACGYCGIRFIKAEEHHHH